MANSQTADPVEAGARCPPLIIRVPPPGPRRETWFGWYGAKVVLGVTLPFTGLTVLISVLVELPAVFTVVIGAVVAAACAGFFLWWLRSDYQKALAARRDCLAQYPGCADDPVATALSMQWKQPPRPLPPNVVVDAIHAAPLPLPPRARIVCFGPIEAPEVGDLMFEPVIVTPTRFIGRKLWLAALALAIITLWAMQQLHLLPWHAKLQLTSAWWVLWIGGVAAGTWVWRTTIRPTYLRLAPGIVQVMEFRWTKTKPTIRSYPMIAGTVVIVQPGKKTTEAGTFTFAREDRQDVLPLAQMFGRRDLTPQVWQALLSTAPTPPLSDDELLG